MRLTNKFRIIIPANKLDVLTKSKKLFSDAKKVIPSGVNSPVRYIEPYPFFVKHSEGSSLWDEDGNRYTDFCNGYGALLLGHTRKEIISAVSRHCLLYTSPSPRDRG